MRKNILSAISIAAILFSGCGSSSESGVTVGSTTSGDTAQGGDGVVAADAAGGDDAAPSDGKGAGDAATEVSDAPGSSDAAVSDTGSTGTDAGSTDVAVPNGKSNCGTAASCVAGCKEGQSPGCVANCILAAPAAEGGELAALLSCVDTTCKGKACPSGDKACMDQCVDTYCLPELLACLDDGTNGKASCEKGAVCIDVCNDLDNPWSCLTTCWNGMSAVGKGRAMGYANCAADAKKAGIKVDQLCLVEIATCYGDGTPGTDKCYNLFGCMAACQAGGGKEDACGLQCLSKLDDAGKAAFKSLIGCWEGPEATTPACQAGFLACAEPNGSLDCAGVLKCAGSCTGGDDAKAPGCMFQCMHQGSPAGAKAYGELFSCQSGGACPEKIVACAAPKGTKSCSETFSCVQACVSGTKADAMGCVIDCMGDATTAGATALAKVIACDDACKKSCGGDGACKEACTKKDCAGDIAACLVN